MKMYISNIGKNDKMCNSKIGVAAKINFTAMMAFMFQEPFCAIIRLRNQ
jgi:hypothetical protein